MNAVNSAFRTIERRAARLNSQSRRFDGGRARRAGGGRASRRMRDPGATLAAKVERDQIRAARRVSRARESAQRKAHREQLRMIAKETRMRQTAERKVAAQRHRTARAISGRVVGSAGRAIRTVGRGAAGLLAMGGGFAVANAVGNERSVRAQSAALANQAFKTTGESRTRQQLQAATLAKARPLGVESGFGAEKVIGSMQQFMAIAGSFRGAEDMAKFMTEISDASGADLGDVGRTAGQIFQSVNNQLSSIKDPQERYATALQKTQDIMKVVAGQAKEGSIEMADMAQNMGKLMSASGAFKGDVADLANTMGAVVQLAIAGGASSPEEAMTALMRLSSDLATKGDTRFAKAGVDVFTDKSKTAMRDPAEIIMQSISKTGGNMAKLNKMFGIRSIKAVEPFRKAYVGAGGGKAGIAAMEEAFARFKKLAMDDEQIRKSAQFRRAQADKQFDIAMAKFSDAIGAELLPALTKLVPKFAEMIPAMAKAAKLFAEFADYATENPRQGPRGSHRFPDGC